MKGVVVQATRNLRRHASRSLLAALGVIIGTAAVLAVVTLSGGVEDAILGGLSEDFDARSIQVTLETEPIPGPGGPPQAVQVLAFSNRDIDTIASFEDVASAYAFAPLETTDVRSQGEILRGVQLQAVRGTPTYSLIAGNANLDGGAVLTESIALRLVDDAADAVGRPLNVTTADGRSLQFTIAGVRNDPAGFSGSSFVQVGTSAGPRDADGQPIWQTIVASARTENGVASAKDRIEEYLDEASDARAYVDDDVDFLILTQADIASAIGEATTQFGLFLGGIGGISLLVGIIGIVNTLLVNVQERTKEVGVLRATGARRIDILQLFLWEAAILCVVGAVLGAILGVLGGWGLIALIIGESTRTFDPLWVILAIGLGSLSGIIAGVYPAIRAARISPVEALRYE